MYAATVIFLGQSEAPLVVAPYLRARTPLLGSQAPRPRSRRRCCALMTGRLRRPGRSARPPGRHTAPAAAGRTRTSALERFTHWPATDRDDTAPAIAFIALIAGRSRVGASRRVAWLLGVPWSEASEAGSSMGIKTVLNEFVADAEFGPHVGDSPR